MEEIENKEEFQTTSLEKDNTINKKSLEIILEECKKELEWFIENTKIEKMNPPSLAFTFTLWRKKIFQNLNPILEKKEKPERIIFIRQFSHEIDNIYFHKFLKKLPQFLFRSFKKIGKEQSESKEFPASDGLLYAYVNWNMAIEDLADLLSRFELYSEEKISTNV